MILNESFYSQIQTENFPILSLRRRWKFIQNWPVKSYFAIAHGLVRLSFQNIYL